MKETNNLKLKKPDGTDLIDIDDFNYNFDVLDKELLENKNFINNTHLTANTADLQSREAYKKAEEAFQLASNGKDAIAKAITGKGIQANKNETFQTLANKISQISTGTNTDDANATSNQLLQGATAYVKGTKISGTIQRMNSVENNPGGTSIINADGIRADSSFLYFGMPKYQYTDNNGWNRKTLSEVANVLGIIPNKIISGESICGVNGTGQTGKFITGTVYAFDSIISIPVPFEPKYAVMTCRCIDGLYDNCSALIKYAKNPSDLTSWEANGSNSYQHFFVAKKRMNPLYVLKNEPIYFSNGVLSTDIIAKASSITSYFSGALWEYTVFG